MSRLHHYTAPVEPSAREFFQYPGHHRKRLEEITKDEDKIKALKYTAGKDIVACLKQWRQFLCPYGVQNYVNVDETHKCISLDSYYRLCIAAVEKYEERSYLPQSSSNRDPVRQLRFRERKSRTRHHRHHSDWEIPGYDSTASTSDHDHRFRSKAATKSTAIHNPWSAKRTNVRQYYKQKQNWYIVKGLLSQNKNISALQAKDVSREGGCKDHVISKRIFKRRDHVMPFFSCNIMHFKPRVSFVKGGVKIAWCQEWSKLMQYAMDWRRQHHSLKLCSNVAVSRSNMPMSAHYLHEAKTTRTALTCNHHHQEDCFVSGRDCGSWREASQFWGRIWEWSSWGIWTKQPWSLWYVRQQEDQTHNEAQIYSYYWF